MLNEYQEAILSLCRLQDEYDDLDIQLSTINRNMRRAKKRLRNMESDIDDLRQEVKEKLLKNKKAEFNYLLESSDKIKKDISDLNNEMNSELENISLDKFNEQTLLDSEILITLSDTFAYLNKEVPEIVGRYEYEYKDCLKYLDNLANKCGNDNLCRPVKSRVQIINDLTEDESKSIFENILDKLIGLPKDLEFSTKGRVIVLSSYLFVIFLAFFNLSFLLLGVIGVGIKSIYTSKREESYRNKCIEYLEDFKSMYQILFKCLEIKKDKYIEDERNAICARYSDIVKAKSAELDKYLADYELNTKSVVVSEEEIKEEVDKEFNHQLEELNNEIEEYNNQKRIVLENQKRCEDQLYGIQDKISKLRDSISEVYWELSKVGSDKLLMKEFFLGFKDYDLISVKHNGSAMSIIYDGESSERNSVLISMFIAQLFSNMLPNVLNITIVDIDYTCRDYSIYNGDVFDILFNYITTEDSIKSVIEGLHAELIKRQSEISPIADTIEDFNRIMIDRNSFTKEYSFIIFQNAKPEYLRNQKLLQLCRTGKTFGIMPIIFIANDTYNKILAGEDTEVAGCKQIIDTMKDYTWKFKQDTLDLEKI